MLSITLDFRDGARYEFTQEQDPDFPLTPGTWEAPYPNTREDSQAYGLVEAWSESSEGPIVYLIIRHGEPTRVSITEVSNTATTTDDKEREAVYRFYQYYGRQGDVQGIFVARKSAAEGIIGKYVYFGEILGKHSEVHGTINREDLTEVTDDPGIVEFFKKHHIQSGYNPLDYIEEDEEG